MTAKKVSRLIAIVGETGSGKSSLAHKIALSNGGEIIAADSRTVYRGMDIGTAKPSKRDQDEIKYHLLDIVEPDESYNAARFQTDAVALIEEISNRNRVPVMVGGTGLFIDSILFNYDFGHKPDSALRGELSSKSLPELQRSALEIDRNLDKNMLSNKRHLIRLIETGAVKDQEKKLRNNTLVIGIKLPRNELRKRIEQRVEFMFRLGLRKEVDRLVGKFGWEHEALTGIGYREFRPYYDGEKSMGEVKKSIVKNTLQFAKRQRTWFKRNPAIEWFDDPKKAQARVDDFI